jgi:hypothetical protein
MVLVNTPAFNDTGKKDYEILQLVSDWLNKTYRRGIKISGLIYFHPISDLMERAPLRNWRALEGICGHHFSKVVLATTMWGPVDDQVGGTKELGLRHFWTADIARGWPMERFLRNRRTAADVLEPILNGYTTTQPLQLQREISDFFLSQKQTTAARALYLQLMVLLRDCEQDRARVIHALNNRNITPKEHDELDTKIKSLNSLMDRIRADSNNLKETSWESFQRFFLLTLGLGPIVKLVPRRLPHNG